MENKIVRITGCTDCPFLRSDDVYECSVEKTHRVIKEDGDFRPITPIWCPVKKNNIIIKY